MALKVGELFASFNLDTSGISGAVNSAEKQLSNIGKGLTIGGAAMTAAVTVPLKQAATAIYTAGTGFDAQMSQVFAIIGEEATGSAETMEALRNKALQMGSTTAFTAAEAGEAMQYMAMAGWKTEDMLEGLEPIMNLAAASGESLGTVSDIVTDSLTAFGLSAADTAHFTDVLAAASSNSNTNVAIMGESFKYVAPLAGSLGYSVDDVAVALGLMANAGIKGSMAGTSLRQILSNLISPTESQAAAMEALGISLYDSNGMVKDFGTLMGDFRNAAKASGFDMKALRQKVSALDEQLAAGTITQEEYDAQIQALTEGGGEFLQAISDLAGARGLSGLLAIMNASDEDFYQLTGSINNCTGAAQRMASVMLDNAQGDITLFNSALEGLEITLWSLAENGFREAIQEATRLVDTFRTADKSTQLGVLKMGALAAAIGPVMMGMGGVITLLPKLAKTFTIVSGPAALLAIGLLALGAAAIDSKNDIGRTFVKAMDRAGQRVRKFGKDVKKQLPTLTANMGRFLDSVSTGIANGLPGIMDGLNSILSTGIQAISANMPKIANVSQTLVRTLANSIKTNAHEIVPAVVDLLTNMAAALISNAPVVLGGMSTVFTSLLGELDNVEWDQVGTKLSTAIQNALTETGTWFKKLAMGDQYRDDATWADVGTALVESIRQGMASAIGNAKNFVGGLILGDSYNPDESWIAFGSKLIDKIFQGAENGVDGAADFVSGILDGLARLFSDENIEAASGTLSALAGKLIGSIANKIPEAAEQAGNILAKLGELIFGKDGQQGLAASAMEGAGTLATAILNAITNALPRVEQAGKILITALADILKPANISSFAAGAETLASNLLTAIANAIGGLGTLAADILTAIGDALFGTDENGDSVVTAGLDALGGIVTTILEKVSTEIIPNLGGAAVKILTAIGSVLFGEGEEEGAVSAGVTALTDIVRNIFTEITTNVIPGMGEQVGNILGAIAQFFTPENMKEQGTGLGDLASSLLTGLVDTLTATIDAILSIGDDVEADEVFSGILEGIGAFAGKIIEALVTVIPKLGASAARIITAIGDAIFSGEDDDAVSGGVTALATILTDIISTITTDIIPSLGSSLSGILTAIGNTLFKPNGSGDSVISAGLTAMTTLMTDLLTALGTQVIPTLGQAAAGIITAIGDLLFGKDENGAFVGQGIGGLTTMFTNLFETVRTKVIPGLGGAVGDILKAIAGLFTKENMEQLGGGLGDLASSIIGGIADAISSVVDQLTSIADSGDIESSLQGVMTGLQTFGSKVFDALVYAIPKIYGAGARLIGAIASTLFGVDSEGLDEAYKSLSGNIIGGIRDAFASIGEAIANGKAADVGIAAGQEVTNLLHAIFSGFTEFATNADVLEFLRGLGRGLIDALGTIGETLGAFAGELIKWLFSGQAITDIYNAGKAMFNLLWEGFKTAVGGVTTFLADFMNSLLISWGVIDKEKAEAYRQAETLRETYGHAFNDVFSEGLSAGNYDDYNRAIVAAIFGTGTGRTQFSEEATRWLDTNVDSILPEGRHWQEIITSMWGQIWEAARSDSDTVTGDWVKEMMRSTLESMDFDPDEIDDEVWDAAANWIKNGGVDAENGLMSLLFEHLFGGDPGQSFESAENEAQAAAERAGIEFAETVEEAGDEITEAMDGSANAFGLDGFTGALADGQQPAEEAALQVSDAVVREFLLTLSADNGKAIGDMYVGGVIAALQNEDLVTAASGAGHDIGVNFGQGLANGISSMTDTVYNAAWNIGITAANALSAAIQEGSPSKLTGESGMNFGLGFINSIMNSAGEAGEAAAVLGGSAAASLERTVGDMQNMAAADLSLPVKSRQTETERYAAESERTAQMYAEAIASSLNGARVVMNGELVGELVTDTVSEGIASRASGKRWGTV